MKPGPRKDGKPAAKDVSELSLLEAAIGYSVGGRFPTDSLAGRYPEVPRKVFVSKQRKLVEKGLMTVAWTLTAAGLERLKDLGASE